MGTDKEIVDKLLTKYENSKTFIGENKNTQNFKVKISSLYPKYDDVSQMDYYHKLNQTLDFLESKELITLVKKRSGKVNYAILNLDKLDECYAFCKRVPKSDINSKLLSLFNKYSCLDDNIYKPLVLYVKEQEKNISENKHVKLFDGNINELSDVLLLTKAILENKEEIFVRELSIKLFNNSKRLEQLEQKVRLLLYFYGSYDDKDTVLEEHNIIKTPTYVMVKGNGILSFENQRIDLSLISGDIGLSTKTLQELKEVNVKGKSVITVENLTNFHKYEPKDELVIYLGGFHNSVKREFIKKCYQNNKDVSYKHFGDIDAGGFYILLHLIDKTGVLFTPYHMDKETLINNKEHWITLTDNDKKRLNILKDNNPIFSDVITYMLENNCKLEQEAEIL